MLSTHVGLFAHVEKKSFIQHGHSKCGTLVRVLSETLQHAWEQSQ